MARLIRGKPQLQIDKLLESSKEKKTSDANSHTKKTHL